MKSSRACANTPKARWLAGDKAIAWTATAACLASTTLAGGLSVTPGSTGSTFRSRATLCGRGESTSVRVVDAAGALGGATPELSATTDREATSGEPVATEREVEADALATPEEAEAPSGWPDEFAAGGTAALRLARRAVDEVVPCTGISRDGEGIDSRVLRLHRPALVPPPCFGFREMVPVLSS